MTALLAEAARYLADGPGRVELTWITPDAADHSMPLERGVVCAV